MPELLTMNRGHEPSREELLVALPYGDDPAAGRLPGGERTPREALEVVLAEHLQRGPCFVLFSGGRDSSTMLAVAVHVARRDGLPLPIPISQVYPGYAGADEDNWQELVIRHLGLDEWIRIDRRGTHEMFGAVAADALRRHGAQFPAVWWTTRLPEEAGGAPMPGAERIVAPAVVGTLINGLAGDELFPDPPRPTFDALLAGGVRAAARHPRRLARELEPRAVRVRGMRREFADGLEWIRPQYRAELSAGPALHLAGAPPSYRAYLRLLHGDRGLRVMQGSNGLAAAESGARLVEPFLDPRVLGAFSRRYGLRFPLSRTAALRELVGDLLPAATVERTSKGDVTDVFIGPESVEWLEGWDGATPDPEVDGAAARRLLLGAARGEPAGSARPSHVAQRALAAQLGALHVAR